MQARTATLPGEAGAAPLAARVRCRYLVGGVVQGVGFRPFVYVTATGLSLTGWVRNGSSGVTVEVEGQPHQVAAFERRLHDQPPRSAIVESIVKEELAPRGGTGFVIEGSGAAGDVRTLASPDIATCEACLEEMADPTDRRYRHPFITCTDCGPRFTIITRLPYDRPATTMADFPLCAECATEYADPGDRRFHAQPIACPDCGPELELVVPGQPVPVGEAALVRARSLLAGGAILAVKGLGGYHLVCDATDQAAVAELRRRKRRGDKPLAVMVADLGAARVLAEIGQAEADLLTSPRRPIVLLARQAGPERVAPAVAPGSPDLGLMLAYTPLHRLLFGLPGDAAGTRALVMTSGNLGGEPIVYRDHEAMTRLAPLVDGWLRHDRPIAVPCDDSVSRVVDGEELPIRRSRGYAPLPVTLPFEVPAILAVGGDVKNAFCVAEGHHAWMSQHIGDMDDLATLDALGATEQRLECLTGVVPELVVADRHPAYRSGGWAFRHAAGRPLVRVQHHHAHIASVMGEHGLDGRERVIGVAFDGTGYGSDGAVWGGEVLVADYEGFERFAHLAYVPLPGGDASVERPYRMALAHLAAAGVDWDPDLPPVAGCPGAERAVLAHQLATGFNCVPTSSMGRLFDAVASLAGVRQIADFEAQAAIELEGVSRDVPPDEGYGFALDPAGGAGQPLVADATPVIAAVVADRRGGVPTALIGARFHAAVADLVVAVAGSARRRSGLGTVVLSGGVFQNALLLGAVRTRLRAGGFIVLCPRLLPPNDGGLALGQVLVGARARKVG
ncbi:MAG: carbamoyltransferase HypF [Acidimicrobiales bacterium]